MKYDLVVIGAGPGGYTAAIRASQLGMKVAIVEKDLIGGICVNWGCTPSKAMISSAKYARAAKHASNYGIGVGEVSIDFGAVAKRRDKIISDSREEIKHLLEHWKVDMFQGYGSILDKNTVLVEGQNLETKNILIATGSQPLIPGFLQKDDPCIVNSNKLITIKELPQNLTIVGGGIIGLEFATIFANLGTKVRIIEMADRILSTLDPEITSEISKELTDIGIEILTSHKVVDIGDCLLTLQSPDGEITQVESPLNLIAIGRKAVFDSEQLKALGIEFTDKGVGVNDFMQTSVENIYAVGDSTGKSILAHVAIQQGMVAAEHMAGQPRTMEYDVIPAVVYTLPEVALVGQFPSESEFVQVVKFPFTANLRANIEGHNQGFVKLWIDKAQGTLLGAQIVGEYAGEIIQTYANIVATKTPIAEMANIIHAHPTYNEVVRNSLQYALGKAIEYV